MYQVYANNRLLFENGNEEEGLTLTAASLDLEVGKTGSFVFTIWPNHPNFDAVVQMAPVTVARNYSTIYGGRILDLKYGFHGEKQVSCEGDLAFLLDSIIAPHTYNGSFAAYLKHVVDKHNALVETEKRFVAGAVTVGDFSPFVVTEKEYVSAFDLLNNKMVASSGGYLQVRYADGQRYLDLLSYDANADNISGQEIELGKNLLDISRETKGANLFSAIIPLGAKLSGSEQRLDIKSVNSNVPYIVNNAAVTLCKGKIYRTVIFDNITNAQTLKTTGAQYLADNYSGEYSVELTAADLSGQDANIDFFRVGQWVRAYNEYHFGYTPQLFLIQKMTVDLLKAAVNKITVGAVRKGLSDEMASLSNSVQSISVPEAVQPYVMESGTTGIWTWKKFSDNTCEFFGKIPVTSAEVTSTLGGWFRGPALYEANTYAYPFQMAEAPVVELLFQTRNAAGALLWTFSQDADTAQGYLPQCYLIRPVSGTGIHGNINIIGKGKLSS